jgi:hypothetical protein
LYWRSAWAARRCRFRCTLGIATRCARMVLLSPVIASCRVRHVCGRWGAQREKMNASLASECTQISCVGRLTEHASLCVPRPAEGCNLCIQSSLRTLIMQEKEGPCRLQDSPPTQHSKGVAVPNRLRPTVPGPTVPGRPDWQFDCPPLRTACQEGSIAFCKPVAQHDLACTRYDKVGDGTALHCTCWCQAASGGGQGQLYFWWY